MNVKIQGGGKGTYANSGTCMGVVSYLRHEDEKLLSQGLEQEMFFNQKNNQIPDRHVVQSIDTNKQGIGKEQAKFFVITVSPSKAEINAMGSTKEEQAQHFKEYINNGVMNQYAQNFNKNLSNDDIRYYSKIHYDRGDKTDRQMHAHIIVSRKSNDGKMKLSPMTNHRATKNGAVKGGFDRSQFYNHSEKAFDYGFKYDRKFENSYTYLNTMKNGSVQDIKNLSSDKKQHLEFNKRVQQEKQKQQQQKPKRDQERNQEQNQERTRNRGRGLSM